MINSVNYNNAYSPSIFLVAFCFFCFSSPLTLAKTENSPADFYPQLTATPSPLVTTQLDLSSLPEVADVDLLTLSDEFKQILDREIAPLDTLREKAIELHRLLFTPMFLGIEYTYGKTYTAQETFDKGKGNCMSHAALYIAAARYVGLTAKFQIVDVPRDWLDRENFYIVPGHMNVRVVIPRNTITVEFNETFSAQRTQHLPSTPISDRQALAEYYNNVGMEYMEQKDYATAIAYMRKSISTYKKSGVAWSNLGVLYKLNGHLDLAQNAYEKGLKYEKRNLSIINNIYILYRQTGQTDKAQKLAKKVAHYSKKNPYFLEKLANSDIAMGLYKQAIVLLKKAIKIKEDESKFYISMAFAYHQMGLYEKSLEAVSLAQDYAKSPDEYNQYQTKLKLIQSYRAGL